MESSASTIQLLGAGGFGAFVGWYAYYVIRHRTDAVSINDVGTIIAAVGGSAVLTLFPAKTDLLGAYGIGLFVGFFGYFSFLMVFVAISPKFGVEWFLDGRRKALTEDEIESGTTPMGGS